MTDSLNSKESIPHAKPHRIVCTPCQEKKKDVCQKVLVPAKTGTTRKETFSL